MNDLARTLENHIAGKSGISGTAMKLGFQALRAAKPDIATRAARQLLPEIAKALDPLHAAFAADKGTDFGAYLAAHGAQAASVVLAAVDARMVSVDNMATQSVYKRFRGSAGAEIQKLLPAFGNVLATHIA